MRHPGFFAWSVLAAALYTGVTWAIIAVNPKPAAEWRVIGFSTFFEADGGEIFLVKGGSYRSQKTCYQQAIRLQDRNTDLTFACAQIFPGGTW